MGPQLIPSNLSSLHQPHVASKAAIPVFLGKRSAMRISKGENESAIRLLSMHLANVGFNCYIPVLFSCACHGCPDFPKFPYCRDAFFFFSKSYSHVMLDSGILFVIKLRPRYCLALSLHSHLTLAMWSVFFLLLLTNPMALNSARPR